MKPIIYNITFSENHRQRESSQCWALQRSDALHWEMSGWAAGDDEEKQKAAEETGGKAHSRAAAGKSLSSRWETLSWIISYTLRITSSSYRSVSLCLLTSQDNTHTGHAEGFLLSPAVDWSIPVQSSTHQELVWDQYEHWCECGDSEESSDSAAGNTRWETQSIW